MTAFLEASPRHDFGYFLPARIGRILARRASQIELIGEPERRFNNTLRQQIAAEEEHLAIIRKMMRKRSRRKEG